MIETSASAEDRLFQALSGVGAGYLKEEFEAAGVSFETRGETLNDHIEVMQKVWAGDPVSITGVGYQAKEVLARPRPTQQAGQGGNTGTAPCAVISSAHPLPAIIDLSGVEGASAATGRAH